MAHCSRQAVYSSADNDTRISLWCEEFQRALDFGKGKEFRFAELFYTKLFLI